jgi:hypothetical protein
VVEDLGLSGGSGRDEVLVENLEDETSHQRKNNQRSFLPLPFSRQRIHLNNRRGK